MDSNLPLLKHDEYGIKKRLETISKWKGQRKSEMEADSLGQITN